jgi:hypothetical protein
MAASEDGEDAILVGGTLREIPEARQRETSDNDDDTDGGARDDATLRLNPEALGGVPLCLTSIRSR